MADFYATYSASSNSSSTVTALQGTVPWIVAGGGTAGASGTAVLTVQGIASGTAMPISGSITATNPSIGATGAAVPASGTYIAASVAGTLTGLVATAAGLKVDGSAATQPVSGTVAVTQSTSPWVISGTATVSGTVAATQSGTWNITNVSGTVSLPTGAATETTLAAINTKTPSLGQAVMASSVPVAIASNQSTLTTDQAATTVATFQDGSIAFGSLTTNYQTVITAGGALKNVSLRNNTTAVIVVSLNSGSTDSYTLDSGDIVSLDLKSLGLNIANATTLQAKYSGAAPTAGSIRINGVY